MKNKKIHPVQDIEETKQEASQVDLNAQNAALILSQPQLSEELGIPLAVEMTHTVDEQVVLDSASRERYLVGLLEVHGEQEAYNSRWDIPADILIELNHVVIGDVMIGAMVALLGLEACN